MIVLEYYKKTPFDGRGSVICLGRFDGLHIGHRRIVEEAKRVAKEQGLLVALFTLKPSEPKGDIFTFEELSSAAKDAGVDELIYAPIDKEFFSLMPNEFLGALISRFNAKRFVCGEDFTYGKDRLGNVATLKEYCERSGTALSVVETVSCKGEKVSSTLVKRLLIGGEMRKASELLGKPYSVSGKVALGRRDGRGLGFCTANVPFPEEKSLIKSGVYATVTVVDGVAYKSVSNFGGAPTFGVFNDLIETHILGFSDDIYGKIITVKFIDFMRENVTFSKKEELESQIKKDIGYYD